MRPKSNCWERRFPVQTRPLANACVPWWVRGHESLETAPGEIINASTWATNGRRKYMCKKKRNWARLGICSLFLGALVLGGLLLGAQPASAQTCIQQGTKSLVCTANDIQVAFANNIRDTSGNPLGQCTSGDTFSFIADFHVTTTASTRYDIGLYFATDGDPNGDGARTGVCSANIITPLHTDTASPGIVT